MTLPDGKASLDAARVDLDDHGHMLDGDALTQMLDIASVSLLSAISGHHTMGCHGPWFDRTARSEGTSIVAGARPDLTWRDLTVRSGPVTIHAAAAHLTLAGQDDAPLELTLTFDHVTLSGTGADVLNPDHLTLDVSIPSSALVSLLQVTAGKGAPSQAIQATVRDLTVVMGPTTLRGDGSTTLTGYPDTLSAAGHLSAQHFPDMITRAQDAGLTRPAAAMVIARLVGHRDGDMTRWTVGYTGGVLTVNNVPLPLR
ncbi:hypothetical protein AA103196_1973 [Ameyamaea chiangmaiensis NBRC 103196]|nr:hypothetical protein AA103196_1973 [Ameyamaea chiangmaiensis NBRC 103196]